MKRLLFWLRPAYAAPEQRHEPSAEQLAEHYDQAWTEINMSAEELRSFATNWRGEAMADELAWAADRIERLEAEVRALTDDCGVLPVPLHVRSRLAHLEQANATLTAKLDQATTYVRDLTEQNEVLQARLNHPSNQRRDET